jgi:hypothetical protein
MSAQWNSTEAVPGWLEKTNVLFLIVATLVTGAVPSDAHVDLGSPRGQKDLPEACTTRGQGKRPYYQTRC